MRLSAILTGRLHFTGSGKDLSFICLPQLGNSEKEFYFHEDHEARRLT
jgi:hypothetical protein